MKQLSLTLEEHQMLTEVLQTVLADLRYEIADTDDSQVKVMLRRRKDLMTNILNSLQAVAE